MSAFIFVTIWRLDIKTSQSNLFLFSDFNIFICEKAHLYTHVLPNIEVTCNPKLLNLGQLSAVVNWSGCKLADGKWATLNIRQYGLLRLHVCARQRLKYNLTIFVKAYIQQTNCMRANQLEKNYDKKKLKILKLTGELMCYKRSNMQQHLQLEVLMIPLRVLSEIY